MSLKTFKPSSDTVGGGAIIIRDKTKQKLNLKFCPNLRDALVVAAQKFNVLDFPSATNYAMHFIYVSVENDNRSAYEKFLNAVGLTVIQNKSFDPERKLFFVTAEDIPVIGAELVAQYIMKTPEFLKISRPIGCEEELAALETSIGSEPVLLYCIMRMINWHYNKDSVTTLVKQLRSNSKEEQKVALSAMQQRNVYMTAMLPHSGCIADLLSAMHEQYKKQEELVELQYENLYHPPVKDETIREKVPEELLTAVPELAILATYIPYHEDVASFLENHKSILDTFSDMAKYGFNIDAYLNDPRPVSKIGCMEISENFKVQLFDLAKKIQDGTTAEAVIHNGRLLPMLLPAYYALKDAFLAATTAGEILAQKHIIVCQQVPSSNNPELLSASRGLLDAIQQANEASQKYQEAATNFKKALSSHPLKGQTH